MKFEADAPRQDILIQGQTFSVPMPYDEGHQLTSGEAAALNQVLAENLRNNFAAQIKRHDEAKAKALAEGKEFSDPAPTQADLDAYIADYDFGVRRTGARQVVDPIEKEALTLAVSQVKEALRKKGLKVSDVGTERIKELATQAVEQYLKVTTTTSAGFNSVTFAVCATRAPYA